MVIFNQNIDSSAVFMDTISKKENKLDKTNISEAFIEFNPVVFWFVFGLTLGLSHMSHSVRFMFAGTVLVLYLIIFVRRLFDLLEFSILAAIFCAGMMLSQFLVTSHYTKPMIHRMAMWIASG